MVINGIHLVRTGSCPSLSGKSTLTYEVGAGPAHDVFLRICKNSGSGYFGKDWVAWEAIRRILEQNIGRPITFHTLSPLFHGKSANTAGFLLAVLKHEGLVHRMAERPRYYECPGPPGLNGNDATHGREVRPASRKRPTRR
jgi:hypothetical protein